MVPLAKLLRIMQGIEKKYKNIGFEKFQSLIRFLVSQNWTTRSLSFSNSLKLLKSKKNLKKIKIRLNLDKWRRPVLSIISKNYRNQ
jgi:hypothetical protein